MNEQYNQADNIKKEREYWTKLKKLANEDNVVEFYKLYSQYLEYSNILSNDRKAIYIMAKRAVELLSNKNTNL
jgi:hypothetical protein